jgi:hypothetical protein
MSQENVERFRRGLMPSRHSARPSSAYGRLRWLAVQSVGQILALNYPVPLMGIASSKKCVGKPTHCSLSRKARVVVSAADGERALGPVRKTARRSDGT